MKQMKLRITSLILALICMISLLPASVLAATGLTAKLSDKTAVSGTTVEVTLSIENNPGISSFKGDIAYDESLLTLESVTYNEAFGGQAMQPAALKSPVSLTWLSPLANSNYNGVFATLTFSVAEIEELQATAAIMLTYDPDNIYDMSETNIPLTVVNGTVTILAGLPGDVNMDGKVNNKDATRLFQHVAGWPVEVDNLAVDCNGDGKVNNKDATRLFQYVAGWPVDVYYAGKLVGKCDHANLKAVAGQAATCTEEGHTAYWYCPDCHKYFNDAAATAEITLESTVIPVKEHNFVNGTCSDCGAKQNIEDEGKTFTIQYHADMYDKYDAAELAKLQDDTYTVGVLKDLPVLLLDKYTFVGWEDDNGNFYKDYLPIGTTGDLRLTACWLSNRNKAVAKQKLDDPLIAEDPANKMIYFCYEIGEIRNVPLFVTQNLKCVNGIIVSEEHTITRSLEKEEMQTIGTTVSKETTDSTQFTLSEELSEITEVSNDYIKQNGFDKDIAETQAKSQTSTQSVSNSSGGSSESYTYNDKEHRNETNQSYVVNENFDTGISHELQTGFKNTTELSAGISLPIDIVKLDLGAKNTTEISANTDTKFYADYSIGSTSSWDQNTYDKSFSANSQTDTKNWNTSVASSSSATASQSTTVSEALHEMISEGYHYGESFNKKSGNSSSRGLASSTGEQSQSSSTFVYSEKLLESKSERIETTGYTYGSYRLAMFGTMHVFAVVGYDIAKQTYFTYTYNVLGDGSANDAPKEDFDYSFDGTFTDCENSVIPFAVPKYVEDYVNSRIVRTEGLDYAFDNKTHEATVCGYDGTDKMVFIPTYLVNDGKAYKVTAIEAGAFANNKNIVAVSLGRGITAIPNSAFEGCSNLEYVVCPMVQTIDDRAFYGCTSMKEFKVSKQVTSLGKDAFTGMPSVIAEVGYVYDKKDAEKNKKASAQAAKVAENVATSGAKSITLNLQFPTIDELGIEDEEEREAAFKELSSQEIALLVGKDTQTFILNGGENTFRGLSVDSAAAKTTLQNVIFADYRKGYPVKLNSSEVTLRSADIENCASYAMLLDAENTKLILSGTNTVETSGKVAIVCRNVDVASINSGRLYVYGDMLYCGAISGATNRITFSRGESRSISEDQYAQYKKGSVTVTLNPNGGSVELTTITAYVGEPIGTLPTPKRDYYTFDGWYTESSGGTKVTASSKFSQNTTLYAHWKENEIIEVKASDGIPEGAQVLSHRYTYTLRTYKKSSSVETGWNKYAEEWGDYGNWSDWRDGTDTNTESHHVESRDVGYTQYRYGRWTNGSTGHFCADTGKKLYGGNWWVDYTAWQNTQASIYKSMGNYYCSNTNHEKLHNPNAPYDHIGYHWNGSGYEWASYKVGSTTYYWEEAQWVPRLQYRYQDRSKIYYLKKDVEHKDKEDKNPADQYQLLSSVSESNHPVGDYVYNIVEWVQYRAK